MGPSDFYTLVREVDPGWLDLTVEGGYGWSLVAWTAAFFLAGAALGALVERLRRPRAAKPPSARRLRKEAAVRRAIELEDEAARRRAALEEEAAGRRSVLEGLSPDAARAALRAYDSDGTAVAGDEWRAIEDSVNAGQGLFVVHRAIVDCDEPYTLAGEWRAFLAKNPRDLAALRQRAGR